MILIGTMNLTRTRETGQFHCPTCARTQEYRLRARRPFLTLYFIPTVPIGAAELFVLCSGCNEKWDPTVLEMDRRTHEQMGMEQFRDEALRAAILIVIADGSISEREIETLERIAFRLLDRPTDRDQLGELCAIAVQNRIRAQNYVLTVCRRWDTSQKSLALQAMFLAATAEGKMDDTRMGLLAEMRDILELTDAEYESAIEHSLQLEQV